MAATVIVIISSGMPSIPSMPRTEPAVMMFGANAIRAIFIDLNKISSIKAIAPKTSPRDLICDENRDWSILL